MDYLTLTATLGHVWFPRYQAPEIILLQSDLADETNLGHLMKRLGLTLKPVLLYLLDRNLLALVQDRW